MSRKDRHAAKLERQAPEQKDRHAPAAAASEITKPPAPPSGIGFSRRSYNDAGELVNEA